MDRIREFLQEGIGRTIEDGVYRIQPQCVHPAILDPVESIFDEKPAGLITLWPVEIQRLTPGGFHAGRKVRSEIAQVIPFGPEVVVNDVEYNRDPPLMARICEPAQRRRPA